MGKVQKIYGCHRERSWPFCVIFLQCGLCSELPSTKRDPTFSDIKKKLSKPFLFTKTPKTYFIALIAFIHWLKSSISNYNFIIKLLPIIFFPIISSYNLDEVNLITCSSIADNTNMPWFRIFIRKQWLSEAKLNFIVAQTKGLFLYFRNIPQI